jgi:hypothetical protein
MIPDITAYLLVGFISMIIGIIALNIILKKEQCNKYNNIRTLFIFFIIGILVHFIVQEVNLDEIYCGKKCQMRIKNKL